MCTKFEIWGQSLLKVIQAIHTVHIVLYIGCSGPVVECLTKTNMLQSTIRPLDQNTWCTVWNAWIKFKMICPQISNWVLSEIQAYWYIILHAYMWLRGISLYSKDKGSSPKSFKMLKIVWFGGGGSPSESGSEPPTRALPWTHKGLKPPWTLAKIGVSPEGNVWIRPCPAWWFAYVSRTKTQTVAYICRADILYIRERVSITLNLLLNIDMCLDTWSINKQLGPGPSKQ